MSPTRELITKAGGPERVAAICQVTGAAIAKWEQRGGIPPKHWPGLVRDTPLTWDDLSKSHDAEDAA